MIFGIQLGRHQQLWKHAVIWLFKASSTSILLWIAFRQVPLALVANAWRQLHLTWALGCLIAYTPLVTMAESIRLHVAGLRVDESPVSLITWIDAYLESRPWLYLLPASAGADAVVWHRLRRNGWSHGGCGFVLLSVRLWALAFWAIIAGITLALIPTTSGILVGAPTWAASPWLWTLGGITALIACAAAPKWLVSREHVRLKPERSWDLPLSLILTSISALITGGCAVVAARSAELPFNLLTSLGLLAWFNFAMALPISLGGLGIQEAVLLRFGQPLGLPVASLLAFSALLHLMRLTMATTGVLLRVAFTSGRENQTSQP